MTEKTLLMPVKLFLNRDIGATVRVVKHREEEMRESVVGILQMLTGSKSGQEIVCISGKNITIHESDHLSVLVTKRKYNKWLKAFRKTNEYKNLVKENSID